MAKWLIGLVFSLLVLFYSGAAHADCTEGSACVEKQDLKVMLDAVREKKCLMTEKPTFKLDSVMVIVDRDRRVFFSGAAPHPYTLQMDWCGYSVKGEGNLNVVAGIQEEPAFGFRLRGKLYVGVLPIEAFRVGKTLNDGWDAGFALDWVHYSDFNFNVIAGFRSAGAAFGMDVTRTMSLLAGYSYGWNGGTHNVFVGASLALW